MLKNEPKPVQNNTLCTIVVFAWGSSKVNGRPVRVFRFVGIEVVTRRSEGTLVKRFVDHVTDTSREPEMKSHG